MVSVTFFAAEPGLNGVSHHFDGTIPVFGDKHRCFWGVSLRFGGAGRRIDAQNSTRQRVKRKRAARRALNKARESVLRK
jgi:hypothetical protein